MNAGCLVVHHVQSWDAKGMACRHAAGHERGHPEYFVARSPLPYSQGHCQKDEDHAEADHVLERFIHGDAAFRNIERIYLLSAVYSEEGGYGAKPG